MIKDTVEGLERGLESKQTELQKATQTLIETFNTIIVPLALLNAGRKKAEEYFQKCFRKEFEEKTATIPPEYQQEPKYNIARQALIGIADTIDQQTLKEAFFNVLTKSFDSRNDDSLYPAYLNIIQQLGNQGLAYFVQFVAKHQKINQDYPPTYSIKTGEINFSPFPADPDLLKIPKKAMLENWVRLGLITLSGKPKNTSPIIEDGGIVLGKTLKKMLQPMQVSNTHFEVRITDFALEFITTVDP